MPQHIAYPAIEQYRNTCFDVKSRATTIGRDANNDPLYDESLPKPTITFTGTVKLHGTNASVCFNRADGLWVQSRESILTSHEDNAGFAKYVSAHDADFLACLDTLYERNALDKSVTIALFGEWCGSGIQRKMGINNLPKSFFIFGAKAVDLTLAEPKETWLSTTGLRAEESRIFNIEDYDQYQITIDFNDPGAVSAQMTALTQAVEAECPVARAFGFRGIGEGIVWKAAWDGELFLFKIKGEKHAVTHAKNAASPFVEPVASVVEFVEKTVTEARFQQAVETVCGSVEGADIRKMRGVLTWMAADIQKEESDTLTESGLTYKEVEKEINNRTRTKFLALMQS